MRKSPETLFTEIEQFIQESRTMLESGALLEMNGLDDQVRSLCETVLQLSQEERIAASERMQHLLKELKALGEAMVEGRDRLADDIRQLGNQKKAAHAYKIADSRDGYGTKSDEDEEE